ncbi:YbaB/EbfC family nucleoid-associated protein [Lapidilactobacillus luobeiensis]|uniref:YbaB/EbfC family nucleoid-associated protein n=1 Tax=Lapidilactobacillus luobeiensis TaxID=2950371 RepID=UPI0021C2CDB3|nr:YbaB/EbfC family nucleoid-associated protein [Lapidilactobacillus luobeiensis]
MRGNPGNMAGMMKKMQKLQKEMQAAQSQLEVAEFTGKAANDYVTITMNGKREVKDLQIKPEVIDPDDPDMLQDLLIEALNNVLQTIDQQTEQTMGKYTRGLM